MKKTFGSLALLALLIGCLRVSAHGQASAIPSAQSAPAGATSADRGRALLGEMVTGLGGDAWLHRTTSVEQGKTAGFYKGKPNENEVGYEAYTRLEPFAQRVMLIAHFGVIIGTDHRDIAQIWTPDAGYEVTYKGTTPVKKEDLETYQRRRAHTLDVLVKDWLQQPGVVVAFDGSGMSGRRLVDTVSVLTATNDSMTVQLDESTHLPVSLSYQYRDPVYKDLDTDEDDFDNYQPMQGIMTSMIITRLHNGDMVSQRFLTKVTYNVPLSDDLFDPQRLLTKKK